MGILGGIFLQPTAARATFTASKTAKRHSNNPQRDSSNLHHHLALFYDRVSFCLVQNFWQVVLEKSKTMSALQVSWAHASLESNRLFVGSGFASAPSKSKSNVLSASFWQTDCDF